MFFVNKNKNNCKKVKLLLFSQLPNSIDQSALLMIDLKTKNKTFEHIDKKTISSCKYLICFKNKKNSTKKIINFNLLQHMKINYSFQQTDSSK